MQVRINGDDFGPGRLENSEENKVSGGGHKADIAGIENCLYDQ
jgi:hypothetical protein